MWVIDTGAAQGGRVRLASRHGWMGGRSVQLGDAALLSRHSMTTGLPTAITYHRPPRSAMPTPPCGTDLPCRAPIMELPVMGQCKVELLLPECEGVHIEVLRAHVPQRSSIMSTRTSPLSRTGQH